MQRENEYSRWNHDRIDESHFSQLRLPGRGNSTASCRRELRGGDAWDATIRTRIKECVLFVPFISKNTESRSEGYFRLEWKLAVDRSHLMADDQPFLMPVAIDDVSEANARVPDRFRERQWARLTDAAAFAAFVDRVVEAISTQNSSDAKRPPSDQPKGTSTRKAIAVLPLANMSADPENEYFSDGITEDIINALAKVPGIQVASRTSSFAFKDKDVDLRQIGAKLGVTSVLSGSVRKIGNRIRIVVQFVNRAATTSGPRPTIASLRTSSQFRMRSLGRSSMRSSSN